MARRKVVFLQQFFQAFCLFCRLFRTDKRGAPKTRIALEVFAQGKFITFSELLAYFEFRLFFTVRHVFFLFFVFFLPRCRALRQPITSVEFKFTARQAVASVVIRAAKLKFVAENRTWVYFAQHVASTYNTILLREKLLSNEKSVSTCNATILRDKLKKNFVCITGPQLLQFLHTAVSLSVLETQAYARFKLKGNTKYALKQHRSEKNR